MSRKKIRKKTKFITLAIDEVVYRKTKDLIQNRSQDYEDYLRRRMNASDQLEMLQIEYEDHVKQMNHLKDLIYKEMEFKEKQAEIIVEEESLIDGALETIERIYQVHGVVGFNDLERISSTKKVELADLKSALPEHIISALVEVREDMIEKPGTLRGDLP